MSEARRRFLLGVWIPVAALAAGGALIWSISRILLAVDEDLAPVIGLLFALNILVAAALAASIPGKGTVLAVLVAVVIPVIAAGLVGFFEGERPVESLVEEAAPAAEVVEETAEEPAEGEEPPAAEESPPAEEPAAEPAGPTATIVAKDILFDTETIELPANTEVTITLDNQDAGVPHNLAIYTDESATEPIFVGEIFAGVAQMEYTFTTPGPGTYFFRCDVHPVIMVGTVVVS